MKTAGQILKETRIKENFEIAQVARATKIRPLYLEALEKNNYQKLPSSASARGFIKNYAEFLGLSSSKILALFRRDFNENKSEKVASLETAELNIGRKFTWTPKLTAAVAIGILVFVFISYLIWQYFSLISAPYY